MAAKIITVCNQKGGSGKTMVAMTLAGAIGTRGFKVTLVDCDRQGTATQWYAAAPDDNPFPAVVTNLAPARGNIQGPLKEIAQSNDVVVIDTPPSLESPVVAKALLFSDLVIVPMIPAVGDLWATTELNEVINQARALREDLVVRIVPNMMQTTSLATVIRDAIDQIGLPVAVSALTLRTAYRQALASGTTVLTLRDPKAIQEAMHLADEVLGLLHLPLKLKKPKLIKSR